MNDFRFAEPACLALIAALPLLYLFFRRLRRTGHERLSRFVSAANLSRLLTGSKGITGGRKTATFWLGIACVALALARPQANPQVEDVQAASLDVYFLLDISRSMDAEDIAPSRLKKAKRTIQRFTELLAGDRVGVVGFAGSAALFIPLTSDYGIVRSMLQNIDTSLIPSQGTDLGGALRIAKAAMERGAQVVGESGDRRSNIFVVLSDGEDHQPGDLGIADEIREAGGLIFTIAFGTEKGTTIPIRNERGELMSYKRDAAGNPVVTAVQTKTLEDIARRGSGQSYFTTADEGEISDIIARVQGAQRTSATSIKAVVYDELFVPFLAAAIALLCYSFLPLSAWIAGLRGRSAALLLFAYFAAGASTALASPLSFLWDADRRASEQSAELAKAGKPGAAADRMKERQAENPDSAAVNYGLGTYLAGDKKYAEAREQLARVGQSNDPLRWRSQFNLAGTYALEKKREAAMAKYADLIRGLARQPQRNPEEEELLQKAKENLARLAQNQQSGGQESSDQSGAEGEKGADQKQGGQGQGEGDKKKDKDDQGKGEAGDKQKDKPNEGKGDQKDDGKNGGQDEQKKEDQKKNDSQGDGDGEKPDQQNQPKLPPRRGGQPFRERDNMSEDDAKQILEALKQQESGLQKKFLKKQGRDSKVTGDDGKDW